MEVSTDKARNAGKVQERLMRVQDNLRRVEAEQRVLREQVAYLDEVADDAETRRLVSGTPLADRDSRDARTDVDRHAASLDDARRQVEALLAERDRLLDRLLELEETT